MFSISLEPYIIRQGLIAACLNIAQLIHGYGVAWTSPVIPKLNDLNESPLSHPITETQAALVASTTYIGIFGFFVGGYLSNKIGRRPCLIISGAMYILSYAILSVANSLNLIYTGRFLIGITMSFIAVTNVIYLGEITSPNIRGIIFTLAGIFHAIGSLLAYCIGPYVSYSEVCYVAIGMAAFYLVCSFYLPESPVFYVIKDDEESAKVSLRCLGRAEDIDKELKAMLDRVRELNVRAWIELFTIKGNRKSMFVTMPLFFFQQTSGIVSVILFTTPIFIAAGSSIEPYKATMIAGATMVLGTIVSPMFIEKYGRKILLLTSTFGCFVSMTILGVYFYLSKTNAVSIKSLGWLPLVAVVIALFTYSVGLNIVPKILTSEMFTSNVRGLGSSICLSTGWLSGFLCTTVYGYVVVALGIHVVFWLFAIINCLAFTFVIIFVPETKGKSLVEINIMMAESNIV